MSDDARLAGRRPAFSGRQPPPPPPGNPPPRAALPDPSVASPALNYAQFLRPAPIIAESQSPVHSTISSSPIERPPLQLRPAASAPKPTMSEMAGFFEEELERAQAAVVDEGEDLTKKANVNVFVRARPLNEREIKDDQREAWKIVGTDLVQTDMTKSQGNRPLTYTFDKIFSKEATNLDLFNHVGVPIVAATMKGFNAVLFAYGQTSSGKTHTLQGNKADPGLVPRCIQEIFKSIQRTVEREFILKVSYLECYNEVLNDLIDPMNSNLKIREDPIKGIYVGGLSATQVASADHVFGLLELGDSHRKIGRTDYNAVSSRSHSVFTINVESQSTGPDKTVLQSTLYLVDLAGSENASRSHTKTRVTETGMINRSLLALGHVIAKIAEGDSGHIPFRDSKLTRLLQPCLNGTALISVCCNFSPGSGNIEETISTMKFGTRAKTIKSTATANEKRMEQSMIETYKKEISRLRNMLVNGDSDTGGASATAMQEMQARHEQEKREMQSKLESMSAMLLRQQPGGAESCPSPDIPARRRPSIIDYQLVGPQTTKEKIRAASIFGTKLATMGRPVRDETEVASPRNPHRLEEQVSMLEATVESLRSQLKLAETEAHVLNQRLEESTMKDFEIAGLRDDIQSLEASLRTKDEELEAAWATTRKEKDRLSFAVSVKGLPELNGFMCCPLVGFFTKKDGDPGHSYAGRTEYVQNATEATFQKRFDIFPPPGRLDLRWSLYDVPSAEGTESGEFLGAVDVRLDELLDRMRAVGGMNPMVWLTVEGQMKLGLQLMSPATVPL